MENFPGCPTGPFNSKPKIKTVQRNTDHTH